MKIGNVEIENSLALGPMAGVTDLPFRLLCKEQGCGMLYTEMVSAKAILYKNKNTNILLNIDKAEHPIAVQLFGSDPDIMAEIGAKVAEGPCDFIDINMGCPVPKIVNNHEGSYLLTQPKLVEQILTKMVKAIKKPVTIKVRKGFKDGEIQAPEIARITCCAFFLPLGMRNHQDIIIVRKMSFLKEIRIIQIQIICCHNSKIVRIV